MKSVTLHVSVNLHPTPVWARLTNDLAHDDLGWKFCVTKTQALFGHSAPFSRHWICRYRISSTLRGNPQKPPLEELRRVPPSVPYNCGHHKQAGRGPSQHTNSLHPKRGRACAYTYVDNTPEIFQYSSRLKWLFFGGLAYDFSYWNVYSEAWSCNFPLCNIFLSGAIEGLLLCWWQWGIDSLLVLWDAVFQMAIIHEPFFHT